MVDLEKEDSENEKEYNKGTDKVLQSDKTEKEKQTEVNLEKETYNLQESDTQTNETDKDINKTINNETNENSTKIEDNSKGLLEQFKHMKSKNPYKFYLIIIGSILLLIILIIIFGYLIKCCKKINRDGYISQIDSEKSNKISGASDF